MVSNDCPHPDRPHDIEPRPAEEPSAAFEAPLFCLRCGKHLTPGNGDFYLVRIEAVADPWPPSISAEDLADTERLASEMQRLIELSANLSEQELMDQVYRAETMLPVYPLLPHLDRAPCHGCVAQRNFR